MGGERMSRVYKVVVEPDEDGGYVASAPSVPGVYEQGRPPTRRSSVCARP